MKGQLMAVLEAMRRPWASGANEGSSTRRAGPSIGQIIAALDDRDPRGALDLLDPPPSTAAAPARRVKCAGGCGE
jgi:hypothetical protein